MMLLEEKPQDNFIRIHLLGTMLSVHNFMAIRPIQYIYGNSSNRYFSLDQNGGQTNIAISKALQAKNTISGL